MRSLTDRWPAPSPEQLLAGFTPPPHFRDAIFDSYVPQNDSQREALANLRRFVEQVNSPARRGFFKRGHQRVHGRYLDGGFGVGKTHLLAAIWNAATVPAAFGTFVGYTNLVGALGFANVVEALSAFRLVCIDEFELDDPGDTVLMSTLCARLVERGVVLAATSNTLPDRLGEERFAADDFMREIQGLAAHFEIVTVDGDDYRRRDLLPEGEGFSESAVTAAVAARADGTVDDFDALLSHLADVHPSRYRLLLADTGAVGIVNARTLTDQFQALRFVVFVDRLYDLDVEVFLSGCKPSEIFAEELLRGGYRKKYFRALSRLQALSARQ